MWRVSKTPTSPVSIHADAAPNRNATGASVWVLSNRRANSEMANWLEEHEKQSELLGGAGDVLANSRGRSVSQPGRCWIYSSVILSASGMMSPLTY